jgi:hypothetical protein
MSSVLNAGFVDLTICAEPGTDLSPLVRERVRVIDRRQLHGEWHNWLASVEWLLSERPTAPLLATCQDDVVLCHDVAAYLDSLLWPSDRCGCLHVYTSRRYACYPPGRVSPLSAAHARRMASACFLVFTRQAAEYLVDYGCHIGWRGLVAGHTDVPHEKQALDLYIGETLSDGGYEIWVHNPSLGQHIAKGSTLGHGGPFGARVAANWPGESASAFDLFGGVRANRSAV